MTLKSDDPDVYRLRTFIETTYSPIPKDEQERLIDSVANLIEQGYDKKQTVNSLLDHASKIIFKFFDFREIAIGLKSRKDGLYRYEILFGYRREIQEEFMRLAYTYEDMTSFDRFPHFQIGRLSSFNFAEGLPDQERHLYALPYQLEAKRGSLDAFHEGDYIDTWINGPGKDLIGWIEMSSPVTKKLPPRMTLRWIEFIASILGSIISRRWKEEGASQK
ncbi:MAG TPA: hypothetical protein VGB78_00090 [Thermoplasmata archaeon]